jgi:hypothetical protein
MSKDPGLARAIAAVLSLRDPDDFAAEQTASQI